MNKPVHNFGKLPSNDSITDCDSHNWKLQPDIHSGDMHVHKIVFKRCSKCNRWALSFKSNTSEHFTWDS